MVTFKPSEYKIPRYHLCILKNYIKSGLILYRPLFGRVVLHFTNTVCTPNLPADMIFTVEIKAPGIITQHQLR